MKRTFAKKGLMSLAAGFFLFGFLLLTAAKADAQTLNHNWKQTDDAKQALQGEILGQKGIAAANPVGSQAYKDALVHAHYYKAILGKIDEGESVAQAATTGLDALRGLVGGPSLVAKPADLADVTLTNNDLQNLYNQAVDFLTI